MESLYLLIPVSIVLVFVIAGLFWWSVRSGQFDDLEGPAHRILMDGELSTGRKKEERGSKGAGRTAPPRGRMPD